MRSKLLIFCIFLLSLISYAEQRVRIEKTVKIYSSDKKILLKKESYKDGQLDGPYLEYYSDGKIKVQGEYYMGLKVNDWFQYSPDGKLIYQAKYFDGVPVGPAFPIEKN